jgi:DNA polymerase III epsilon subunit-like protein
MAASRPRPFQALPPAPPPQGVRALVLDTETTGLDPQTDRVIEIGVVEASGDVDISCWSTLVRADVPVPARVTELTGITSAMAALGAQESAAIDALSRLLAQVDIVVAWNAGFDRAFVSAAFFRCGRPLPSTPWTCALEAARLCRPDLKGYRLDLVARDLGVDTGHSHRALDDARTALRIWRALAPLQRAVASSASTPPSTVTASSAAFSEQSTENAPLRLPEPSAEVSKGAHKESDADESPGPSGPRTLDLFR